mmetsp:Transcript_8069/g.20369  ORF Transcript_8069/g.20369 Transcript_8069/m.20369 type:complete len:233 (+) Transcript_8069:147-845(+)
MEKQLLTIFLHNFETFLKNINQENYSKLKEEYFDLMKKDKITLNAKEYILSQFPILEIINNYTIPVLNLGFERLKSRFNYFYQYRETKSDILISDLNSPILHDISFKLFNKSYFSFNDKRSEMYEGKRYGNNFRILFMIPVKEKNIVFLLDTRSKHNYICEEVCNILKIDFPHDCLLQFNSLKTKFYHSEIDERLREINVLGDEFLRDIKCKLFLDYTKEIEEIKLYLPRDI